MTQFNELVFNTEAKTLIVDTSVQNLSYFADVYIKAIYITTEEFSSTGIPAIKVYTHTVEEGANLTNVRLEITSSELLVDNLNHLFFVYVETIGNPSAETPCGADTSINVGVIYDRKPLYDRTLCFINKLDDKCSVSKEFMDFILKMNALEYAFKTKDYSEAIYYFNKFFATKQACTTNPTITCNCHG
jgi:hypothetical protein